METTFFLDCSYLYDSSIINESSYFIDTSIKYETSNLFDSSNFIVIYCQYWK